LPFRKRRAARPDRLVGQHLGKRIAGIAGDHGQLRVRAVGHRGEPRGVLSRRPGGDIVPRQAIAAAGSEWRRSRRRFQRGGGFDMTMHVRMVWNGLLAFASALMIAPLALGAPVVFKISHQFPANTDFRDQIARKFAQEVEKRTNGEVKFQIYPGASLYKPTQQFDALANGSLDMSVYPLAYSGGKLPATNLTLMPALIENYQQAYDWEKQPIGKWLEDYLDQHGVKIITWIWQGGGVASRDNPILVPADVKGLKTRGAGKEIELMLQAAGASIATF